MVGQLEKEKKNKEPRGNPDGKTIVNISKKKKGNKQTKNEKKKKKKTTGKKVKREDWKPDLGRICVCSSKIQRKFAISITSSFNVQCKCTLPVICRHVSFLRRYNFIAFKKQSVKC